MRFVPPRRWIFRLVVASAAPLLAGAPGRAAAVESTSTPAAMSTPAAEPAAEGEADSPVRLSWDTGVGRRPFLPALEIVGFEALLNLANRELFEGDVYDVTLSTIERNLRHGWVVDQDPFQVNQLGHPYQGSIYHGFARSAGLDYWRSLGYTFAGSALWEVAGETTFPSKNDQVASGIGGSFLGEALFRMASLLLERGPARPERWRDLAAAAISPSAAFNRRAFGETFDDIFPSRGAAFFSRFSVGVSSAPQNRPGASTRSGRTEALVDFALDYGLPGEPDYDFARPFDSFTFRATASSENILENVIAHGLLLGKAYGAGDSYRGVWGLYGGYDYLSPLFFRVSSTAVSLGTSGQWWLTDSIALQQTSLLGAGYAAVSTLGGSGEPDHRYGVAPQALLELRLILGDRASFDLTGQEYFVSGVASNRVGHDSITRVDASFVWRLRGQHAIAVKYLWNCRQATFDDRDGFSQTRGSVGLFYTLLGDERLGTTDWR